MKLVGQRRRGKRSGKYILSVPWKPQLDPSLPRPKISNSDYKSLRAGDIVVWGEKKLRTVLCGPADDGSWGVTFSKQNTSWTKHPTTTYTYSDVCRKIQKTGLRLDRLISENEERTLEVLGYTIEDLQEDLKRYKIPSLLVR